MILMLTLAVLLYSSIVDVRTMKVPNHVLLLLFLIGLIDFKLSFLIQAIFLFIILFIMVLKLGGIGGGDIKIIAVLAFVVGLPIAIISAFVGILIAQIFTKLKHSKELPLVPFITSGFIFTVAFIIFFGGIIF